MAPKGAQGVTILDLFVSVCLVQHREAQHRGQKGAQARYQEGIFKGCSYGNRGAIPSTFRCEEADLEEQKWVSELSDPKLNFIFHLLNFFKLLMEASQIFI